MQNAGQNQEHSSFNKIIFPRMAPFDVKEKDEHARIFIHIYIE